MLPTGILELRECARRTAHLALNRAGSREDIVRVFEILAAEARQAGLHTALEALHEARLKLPLPEVPTSSPMYLYAQGYDHAARDIEEMLTCLLDLPPRDCSTTLPESKPSVQPPGTGKSRRPSFTTEALG